MKRSSKGQSMVEYALGIGCVTAVAMAALGAVGHLSGHIFWNVGNSINYQGGPGQHSLHPEEMVNLSGQAWNLQ